MIECKECGCPYDERMQSCPECGNPTDYSANMTGKTNCPNCGAPLTGSVSCEYCGTEFPRIPIQTQPQVVNIVNQNNGVDAGVAAFLGGVVGGMIR